MFLFLEIVLISEFAWYIEAGSVHGLDEQRPENIKIYNDLRSICKERGKKPKYRIIYVTPKKLLNGKLFNLLKNVHEKGKLDRIVVDEAHCCHDLGSENFRPDYGKLGILRDTFGGVPMMACTATANNDYIRKITNILG